MHDFNLTATKAINFLGDLQPLWSRAEIMDENVALQRGKENIAAISCSSSRLKKKELKYNCASSTAKRMSPGTEQEFTPLL